MKIKSKILIIAGSDSSGGAGIQADIKTVTALGSYALTAITAVTVQNTKGVKSVIPIAPNQIKNQIIYSAKDIKPDAIKIGMLNSKLIIKKVLASLKKLNIKKVVLDPVMVAKGGTRLINEDAIKVLKKDLINQVSLITPNIPEAEVLTGIRIKNKEDMILAANELIKFGAKNVVCSWRTKPMGFKWPQNIEERPLVQRFEGRRAWFKDGTSLDVDAVIFCTGYLHSYPFLR